MNKKSSPETILLIAGIFILLLIAIYLFSPCAGNHDDFLSALSLGVSILTLVFGYSIYDKLDTKKLSFNRKSSAVDELVTELTWLRFRLYTLKYLCPTKGSDDSHFDFVDYSPFYLNRHNLSEIDKEEKYNYQVYFTSEVLERIKSLSRTTNNIWLPNEIGNKLKPIFINSKYLDHNLKEGECCIIIADPEEAHDKIRKYYRLEYSAVEDDLRPMNNYKELLDSFTEILGEFENWYTTNFDDSPDLQGDFNPRK